MFRQEDDASPYDLTRARPQVAGEYEAEYVGGSSPWYAGKTYIANATLAAKMRRVEEQKAADFAARRDRFHARQAGAA